MLSAGSVVAGYRIERVLGTGGMGAAYLAANPTLPRRDVLKVLSAELSHTVPGLPQSRCVRIDEEGGLVPRY
jgi:serine/threonine protein kinase